MLTDPRLPSHDLLGNALDQDERELVQLYLRLKDLAARDDIAPCVLANVKQALVMMWNACADLDLVCEEPGVD